MFVARLAFLASPDSGDRADGGGPPWQQALQFMFSKQLQEVRYGIIQKQGFPFFIASEKAIKLGRQALSQPYVHS